MREVTEAKTGKELYQSVLEKLEDGKLKPGDENYGHAVAHCVSSMIGIIGNYRSWLNGGFGNGEQRQEWTAGIELYLGMLGRFAAAVPDLPEIFSSERGLRDGIKSFLKKEKL